MPKNVLRISVGSTDGPKSAVWNIIGRSTDLYLNTGPLMERQKLSIHASGKRIYAFINDDEADKARRSWGLPGQTRRIVEWTQPTEEIVSGFVHELSICIPTADLSEYAAVTTEKEVVWISAPPVGYATEIMVIMPTIAQSADGHGIADFPPSFSNCWQVGPGFVGYQYVRISTAIQSSIDECRQVIRGRALSVNSPKYWRAISEPAQVNNGHLRIMYDLCPDSCP